MLVRLMYASRAAQGLDAEELHNLLRQCRANNPRNGITGILCHAAGTFVQVLEGGRSAVNRLYNRIVADPRHADVELLVYEEIDERRFAGWAMGQLQMAGLNPPPARSRSLARAPDAVMLAHPHTAHWTVS